MNALSRCLAKLQPVMDAENDGKVIIAERAIDHYIKSFDGFEVQLKAAAELEKRVRPLITNGERSVILARIDSWRRTIDDQSESE